MLEDTGDGREGYGEEVRGLYRKGTVYFAVIHTLRIKDIRSQHL